MSHQRPGRKILCSRVFVSALGAMLIARAAFAQDPSNPENQLPPGDIAAAMAQLNAQPKVPVPEPGIQTPQLPYEQLSPRPMWIEKVKDGLYLIRGPLGVCMDACRPGSMRDGHLHEPGDVAVRVTGAGVILVDDKFADNVPDIVRLVKSVTDEPIKYLVNSHFHTDHAGGNGEMLKRGVIILDQQALRDSYDKGKRYGASPELAFDDYGAIVLGNARVEMYHFGPGHTRGDTTIYFPDLRIIHMGDVVVEGMPHIDYTDGGTAVGMLNEIYSMLKLDWDFGIPGHGRILTRDEVRDYARKFEVMNARMRQIVLQGIPRDKAAAALKLDDLGWEKSASSSTFFGNDVGHFYDEMARVIAQEKAMNTRPSLTPQAPAGAVTLQ